MVVAIRLPNRPHQLASSPFFDVRCARSVGVHSISWILAISAALISRAVWNSCSSSQAGYSARRRSQMALCSYVNRWWNRLRPTHQLSLKPVTSMPLSSASRPWPST